MVSIALLITALVPVESVEFPVALSIPSFRDLRERKHIRRSISLCRSTRISCFRIFCTRKNADNFDVKKKGLNYRSSQIISFTLMVRQKRFIPKFKYLCISDNKIYQCAFICLCKNRVCSRRDNLIRKKHLFYK